MTRPARDKKGKLLYDHNEVQLIEFAGRICTHPNKAAVEREMGLVKGSATRMLANPVTQKHIARIQRQAVRAAQITPDAIAAEAALMAFGDLAEFVEVSASGEVHIKATADMDPETRRALVEIAETNNGVRIKLGDKLGALRLLADMQGLTKTKTELSGPNGGPIQTESAVRVYLPHNGRERLPVDEE